MRREYDCLGENTKPTPAMKLVCLSNNPSKPCFVLYFKSVALMLDCGLDISQIAHFLPLLTIPGSLLTRVSQWSGVGGDKRTKLSEKMVNEFRECMGRVFIDGTPEFSVPEFGVVDVSQIDAVLISNFNTMLALPYLTQYTNFHGKIYATEPTIQIGRMYMEEMVKYIERNPKLKVASAWKEEEFANIVPPPLRSAVEPRGWRKFYTQHDIDACLSKIQAVGFNEKLDVFGALQVQSVSSGCCIGSSNWIIQSAFEKICYVSGTSTLTTHPKPMEQAPLKNSDVLILTCLTQTPLALPDPMIGEFCVNAAVTVKHGGSVLVPCYPSGVTYDLFECLSGHLDQCGLSNTPMYFVSPVSDGSLAYSNIYAEWLSTGKQSKVYLPECPFPHAELVNSGRLRHFKDINELGSDFQMPCILFTGHPSLRMGDAVHFIEAWGKNAANTVIFTEPDFPYLEALGPFQPLMMRVCYCPVDTSLSFAQANKLIRDLRPLHLVVSETYTTPPPQAPLRSDLTIDWEPSPLTYKKYEVVNLPVKRQWETVLIDPLLAAELEPVEVKPGAAICMLTATLVSRDNKYTLKPLSMEAQSETGLVRRADGTALKKTYLFGSPNIQNFVDMLTQQGISSIKVEETETGSIIHLKFWDKSLA
ncbi:integrator complex subunit 9-like isoform X2 [Pomacea canaliculata]|uniref:integrator complex subunit 9-like isoform X2 n=1 Tax=Pomacea canaliculata TaxID=400727 RepID=UPI000D727F2B|nr:integrator complex subunit 9-like isoform X2 [Pomacea canaliculata]XP_025103864.1 integrator complex subunit 9-like isoform X2 [Pomacea canaliculata]